MYLKTLIFCLLLYISNSFALQFSATAVMSTPNSPDSSSKIYFSPGKIRKEYFYYGEPVIQILNSEKKHSLMCFSNQKLCYENKLLEKIDIGIKQTTENPCAENTLLSCEKVAVEQLNKRKTIKWKVTQGTKKHTITSYIWVDAELNIPVKNLLNGQTTFKLIWQGDENLGSRNTQKWLEIMSDQEGKLIEKHEWFDKELRISIKQSYPDGSIQELKDISIEPINKDMFEVPLGFAKQTTQ